jgi:hypothetical protein
VLDQRKLWNSVTMPGAGWTALLLEPGRSADGQDGALEPVLVLVGAGPAKPEPSERQHAF